MRRFAHFKAVSAACCDYDRRAPAAKEWGNVKRFQCSLTRQWQLSCEQVTSVTSDKVSASFLIQNWVQESSVSFGRG